MIVPERGSACGDTWECAGHSLIEESRSAAVGMKNLGHTGVRKRGHASVAEHGWSVDSAAAAALCDLQGHASNVSVHLTTAAS